MFEISAVAVLVLLGAKEILSAEGRSPDLSRLLYLPVLPLLVLFAITAFEEITRLPSLTG